MQIVDLNHFRRLIDSFLYIAFTLLQSVDEVYVVFPDDVGQKQSVKIFIGGKVMTTSQLSRGVYVFSSQGMCVLKI